MFQALNSVSLPIIAWWLGVSLLSALLMDAAMVVYDLFFAYFYNLAYDKLFPLASQNKRNKKAALP
ncbi:MULTISPECIES: chlorhexidine efflux transporter [unclassified Agarivorans]|uniref:chlorhexidine efflux transporter n=1 Tax=unclassified Agarivorans TaxID=2636026 RepID=UPI003D7C75B3